MCFNQTTSFITFSISLLCFSYLLYNGLKKKNKYDIFAGVITLLIGLMQLIEFFLWRNQDCNSLNHIFSLLIMVVLYLQALLGSMVHLFLFGNTYPTWFKNMIYALNGFYLVFALYLLYWLNKQPLCSQPSKESCRLVWAPFVKMTQPFYGISLSVVFFSLYFLLGSLGFGYLDILFFQKINKGIIDYPLRYGILPFTFWVATLYSFYYKGEHWGDIFGTVWCFLAIVYGIISCLHI